MATDKKAFTMRLEPSNYEKFQSIAKKNRRSMAGELELIVEQYIANYESQNGQIPLKSGGGGVIQNSNGGLNYLAVNGNQYIG